MADAGGTSIHALLEQHYPLLYRYAYRLSGRVENAEDLVQQTCLIAQRSAGQLRSDQAAKAWLCTILRHEWLRVASRANGNVSLDDVGETADLSSKRDSLLDEDLNWALSTLPEEFRSPVVLYYFEEFSYREIAGILGIPMGTVMSRLSRAKKALREKLDPDLPTDQAAIPPCPAAPAIRN